MVIKWTWKQVEAVCKSIAANLKGQHGLILGLQNGGVIPAMLVYKYLNSKDFFFSTVDPNLITNNPSSYLARIVGCMDNVIFIDDINDSGETINNIGEKFKEFKVNYPQFIFMTMIARNNSKAISYSPIVVDHNDWFKFPWELDSEPNKRTREVR